MAGAQSRTGHNGNLDQSYLRFNQVAILGLMLLFVSVTGRRLGTVTLIFRRSCDIRCFRTAVSTTVAGLGGCRARVSRASGP